MFGQVKIKCIVKSSKPNLDSIKHITPTKCRSNKGDRGLHRLSPAVAADGLKENNFNFIVRKMLIGSHLVA